MRILVDGMPVNKGGIGSLLINIVRYNSKLEGSKKNDFEFLLPENSEYRDELLANHCKCFFVPRIISPFYKSVITKVFRENRYDYLWVNNTSKVNVALLKIAKEIGHVKIISHAHGIKTEETGLKGLIFKIIEYINYNKYCDLIDIPLACSRSSANYFYPQKMRNKVKIVSNGIDIDKYRFDLRLRKSVRECLKVNEDEFLIGAVGRLTRVKNYMYLIDIMKLLPANYKCIILGDGEDKPILQSAVKKNGLNKRIRLLGSKNNVNEYLSAMDVFIMPSLNEGMPFSIVEAQVNGLICIVSDGVSRDSVVQNGISFISLKNMDKWIETIENVDKSYREKEYSKCMSCYSIENSYYDLISVLK